MLQTCLKTTADVDTYLADNLKQCTLTYPNSFKNRQLCYTIFGQDPTVQECFDQPESTNNKFKFPLVNKYMCLMKYQAFSQNETNCFTTNGLFPTIEMCLNEVEQNYKMGLVNGKYIKMAPIVKEVEPVESIPLAVPEEWVSNATYSTAEL